MKVSALLALIGIAAVAAQCPNSCSGHGKCAASDKCVCHQNWQGADCSLRTCPFELAWVDTALRADDAHYYAECANKGVCDRKTGECKCFDGYEGKGCQRSTCPNDCSGHGTCEYIEELAVDSEDKRVAGVAGLLYSKTQWDWHKIQGCKCDVGFEGADCSERVCPMGDDPLTSVTKYVHEKQRISVGVPSSTRLSTASPTDVALDAAGALTSASGFVAAVGDLLHLGGSELLFQVTTSTDANNFVVDQGVVLATQTAYFVKSALGETGATSNADTTPTKTLAVSATATAAVGDQIQIANADGSYVIQSIGAGPDTYVLDRYIVMSGATSGTAAVYLNTHQAPAVSDEWFMTYYDPYGGMWNTTTQTVTASVTTDASTLQTALRSLPNRVLDDVTVSGHTGGTGGFFEDGTAKKSYLAAYEFVVTFTGTTGTSGSQHLFEVNGAPTTAGSFPLSAGLAQATHKNKHNTAITSVAKEGSSGKTSLDRSELATCSNRGLCDSESGQCTCFSGFRGLSCEFQEALV